jgi:hypothetical protein
LFLISLHISCVRRSTFRCSCDLSCSQNSRKLSRQSALAMYWSQRHTESSHRQLALQHRNNRLTERCKAAKLVPKTRAACSRHRRATRMNFDQSNGGTGFAIVQIKCWWLTTIRDCNLRRGPRGTGFLIIRVVPSRPIPFDSFQCRNLQNRGKMLGLTRHAGCNGSKS